MNCWREQFHRSAPIVLPLLAERWGQNDDAKQNGLHDDLASTFDCHSRLLVDGSERFDTRR